MNISIVNFGGTGAASSIRAKSGQESMPISRVTQERVGPLRRYDVQHKIVHDKRSLQARVFRAHQIDLNCLSFVSGEVERDLRVACTGVEIRIRGQCRQDRARRVSDLYFQSIVGRRGRGLGGVDVTPEREIGAGSRCRNCDLLQERIGMTRAIAIQPGFP